jgi:predicted permease
LCLQLWEAFLPDLLTYLMPIALFAILVGVGLLLRATKVLKSNHAEPFNNLIVWVTLPCFVFDAMHGAALQPELLGVVATGWLLLPVCLGLAWLLCRALKCPPQLTGAVLLAAAWANTGFMGYPLTQAIFGAGQLPAAVFYDLFATVVSLVLVGTPIAAHYGRSRGKAGSPLLALVKTPTLWALALALLLRDFPLPSLINDAISMLAAATVPLIMVSVGLTLSPRRLAGNLRLVLGVGVIKLLVAPALAIALSLLLIGPGTTQQVTVLEAAMPTMMLTLVWAERYHLDKEFIATIIFLTIILSALTVPLTQFALSTIA